MSPWKCEQTDELLDSGALRDLSADALAPLRQHAETCSDCAALLHLREQLALPPDDELESWVPDTFAHGMWPRVESSLKRRGEPHVDAAAPARRVTWLVPAFAAGVAFLLLATGVLFVEVRRLRQREVRMTERLQRQEAVLNDLAQRFAPRDARPASGVAVLDGLRGTPGGSSLRVTDLVALLERTPPSATLINADDVDVDVVRRRIGATQDAAWAQATQGLALEDGLQARELAQILKALQLDPQLTIPRTRIRRLLRGSEVRAVNTL